MLVIRLKVQKSLPPSAIDVFKKPWNCFQLEDYADRLTAQLSGGSSVQRVAIGAKFG